LLSGKNQEQNLTAFQVVFNCQENDRREEKGARIRSFSKIKLRFSKL
jgi:hypothetical protein